MGLFNQRRAGQHYETMAADYLTRHQLQLIEKNFTTRAGEIDLIMRHGSCLVFVEVKYRKNQAYGHAAEMVTTSKKSRLIKAANWWMLKRGLNADTTDFRFDVVAIHQNGLDIEWIKNAITQG